MHVHQGNGNYGTKPGDHNLKKRGIFKKAKKISSLLKRIHLLSTSLKFGSLFEILHDGEGCSFDLQEMRSEKAVWGTPTITNFL